MTANLTEKQRRFCEEYLIDLNATRAYKAAYSAVKKDATAAQAASRMLRNVKVKDYLEKRMRERQIRTEITQDRVLQEIAAIAFADIGDVVNVDRGHFCVVNTDDLPTQKRAIIAEIKEGKFGVEIKMNDRLKALELLGKHLGMFSDKQESGGQESVEVCFAGETEEAAR